MASTQLIMDDLHYVTDSIKNAPEKQYLYNAVVEALDTLGHDHEQSVEAAKKFFGVTLQ